MNKHLQKLHAHIKRNTKRYIYAHLLLASLIFAIISNSNNVSHATEHGCTDTHDKTSFVLVKKVQQLKPKSKGNESDGKEHEDMGSHDMINKENGNESDVNNYLRNKNLNSLIDKKGGSEIDLDIEFENEMDDQKNVTENKNSNTDLVGEITIFEKNINGDMDIQAIDRLNGNPIGKKISLRKQDETLGYQKINLKDLGVSSLKYLRTHYTVGNEDSDLKILGSNTLKCQEKTLEALTLEPICSPSPESYKLWKVSNPNRETINFSWSLYKNEQEGIATLGENTGTIIKTTTIVGANIMRLFVDNEQVSVMGNTETKCPIVQPPIKLQLTPICSPDPEGYRVWKVSNPNNEDVEFNRDIGQGTCKGDRKNNVCHVPPGNPENEHNICLPDAALAAHMAHGDYLGNCKSSNGSTGTKIVKAGGEELFSTPSINDPLTVTLYVGGIQHDQAVSNPKPAQCIDTLTNDYILEGSTNKDRVSPYENLSYTLKYKNSGPAALQSGFIDLSRANYFEISGKTSTPPIIGGKWIDPAIYRIQLSTLTSNQSGSIIIQGNVKEGLQSGDILTLIATLSGAQDSNLSNNTVVVKSNIKDLASIELTPICSANPASYREWRLGNANAIAVPVKVYQGDKLITTLTTPPNDFTYFRTATIDGLNTISIRYNNKKQDEKASESVNCSKPVSDLLIEKIDTTTIDKNLFTITINTTNFGPNDPKNIVVTTSIESGFILEDGKLVTQVTTIIKNLAKDATQTIYLTGVWKDGSSAEINSSINGDIIDPNILNNEGTATAVYEEILNLNDYISTGGASTTGGFHGSAESIGTEIQGIQIGEQVDPQTYTGETIGLGCKYSDEPYQNIKFKDTQKHWSKEYVELLRQNCIVKGKAPNLFATDDLITRAEAIKIVVKMRGIQHNRKIKSEKYLYLGDTPMQDVNNSNRVAKYVDKAYSLGLLDNMYAHQGTDKYIYPNKNITRAEAEELISKMYSILNDTSTDNTQTVLQSKDIHANNPITRSEFSKSIDLTFKDFLPVFAIK